VPDVRAAQRPTSAAGLFGLEPPGRPAPPWTTREWFGAEGAVQLADRVAAGMPTKVFETEFRPMKTAFTGGALRTRMKLLVDAATDRVEAVHMVGPDAPEIVQSLAVALTAGATKAHFDCTLALHPTAAEEFVLKREPARVV